MIGSFTNKGDGMKTIIFAALVSAALVGCATSHILVGTQRPPIDPSQVRVYLDPPERFEKIAMLESSSQGSPAFTAQQKTNKVIERMREEAANLGANGILIQGMSNQSAGTVGSISGSSYGGNYTGIAIGGNVMMKAGSALAIYVEPHAVERITPPGSSTPIAEPCPSCAKIGKGF